MTAPRSSCRRCTSSMMSSLTFCGRAVRVSGRTWRVRLDRLAHLGDFAVATPGATPSHDVPLLRRRHDYGRLVDLLPRELHVSRQFSNLDAGPRQSLCEFESDFGGERLQRRDIDDFESRGRGQFRRFGHAGQGCRDERRQAAKDREECDVGFTLTNRTASALAGHKANRKGSTHRSGRRTNEHVLVRAVRGRVDDRLQPVERFVGLRTEGKSASPRIGLCSAARDTGRT